MELHWIDILKCPMTGQEMRQLTPEEIDRLNSDRLNGTLIRMDSTFPDEIIEEGLTSSDGQYTYLIVKGIVILLKNLAIVRASGGQIKSEINKDKELVQNFYDQKGWFTDQAGNYEDAVIYEDLREVSKEYLKKCHDRVSRYLNTSGTYMLDAASGAIQYPDYLQYSAGYAYRVCVDFSFQALREAKKKLGNKGIYILADMTDMPFKDNVMDGFISLNTVYHIPKDEQAKAIHELYRVLAKNGKGVVVYDWFKHSPWMNISLLPFRAVVFLKNRLLGFLGSLSRQGAPQKRLYFYAHTLSYFRKHLPPFKLTVWRSISVPFMRYYIHRGFFGKELLKWVYLQEEKDPERCGKKGEYPMFIFEK